MEINPAGLTTWRVKVIYNTLFNPRYGRGLSPTLVETLTAVRQYDLAELAQGRHEIKGEKIFMDVMTLTTGLAETRRAELHQEYAAIHLLLGGEERIDYGLPGIGKVSCLMTMHEMYNCWISYATARRWRCFPVCTPYFYLMSRTKSLANLMYRCQSKSGDKGALHPAAVIGQPVCLDDRPPIALSESRPDQYWGKARINLAVCAGERSWIKRICRYRASFISAR